MYDRYMKESKTIISARKAGLSEKEALVYATLLELGGAFPSQIAKEAGLNRSTVYEVLDSLAIKGLISELRKRNKFFYSIEHPKRLVHFSERSIMRAQNELQKLQEYLPELEGLYAGATNKPKVSYFEGFEGVMEIYEDHVAGKERYEMVGFVNVAELMQFLPLQRYRKYVRTKARLGIVTRGIIPDTPENRAYERSVYGTAMRKILPKIRVVPAKDFPWKGDITLYGTDKVSIINFDGQRVTGIIIESATIHQMMRMVFELAWKGAGSDK
jgi:sugar-specific transcriptional regulator TrmB